MFQTMLNLLFFGLCPINKGSENCLVLNAKNNQSNNKLLVFFIQVALDFYIYDNKNLNKTTSSWKTYNVFQLYSIPKTYKMNWRTSHSIQKITKMIQKSFILKSKSYVLNVQNTINAFSIVFSID